MLNAYEQHSKRKLIATILSVIVIAGFVVFADHMKAESAENTSKLPAQTTTATTTPSSTSTTPSSGSNGASNATSTNSSTSSTPSTNSSGYADGTYTASSSYYVPHGYENIQVSVTLKDGVITSSSITNSEGDRESAGYQQDFASVYKNYVVGKKISGLQLGVIAGASDTTQGFADALNSIASKAQA